MTIGIERTVSFTVDGPPVPKGRPRFTYYNGHAKTYTPKRTAAYEREIGEAWVTCRAPEPRPPQFAGTVRVTIRVFEGSGHAADLDNYVKVVLDALNGLAWADDRQVGAIHAWIERGDAEPALSVVITGDS